MKFNSYDEAQKHQLAEWLAGRPWHNPWSPGADKAADPNDTSEGECCPDFSCCNGNIAPYEVRKAFVEADDKTRFRMLFGFLGNAIGQHTEAKVHLAGDPDIEQIGKELQ